MIFVVVFLLGVLVGTALAIAALFAAFVIHEARHEAEAPVADTVAARAAHPAGTGRIAEGDRVRVTSYDGNGAEWYVGRTGTVERVRGKAVAVAIDGGDVCGFTADELERLAT